MTNTPLLIDASSIMWLSVAVIWGYVFGQVLALLATNWWRVRRAVSEWWSNLPPVASLRVARAREEFKWWWVNATPEQRDQWLRNTERVEAMTRDLAAVFAATGVSFQEASESFSAFGEAWVSSDLNGIEVRGRRTAA